MFFGGELSVFNVRFLHCCFEFCKMIVVVVIVVVPPVVFAIEYYCCYASATPSFNFWIRNLFFLLFLFFLRQHSSKNLRLRRFKSDHGQIWLDCSSTKCASIDVMTSACHLLLRHVRQLPLVCRVHDIIGSLNPQYICTYCLTFWSYCMLLTPRHQKWQFGNC